jgi:hypothetical protein
MKNEEAFKNKLNDLVHSKAFPFDETNWEKAQKLMGDTKVAPKFSNKYIVLAIVTLLLVAGIPTYFIFQNKDAQNISQVKISKGDYVSTEANTKIKNEDNLINTTKVNSAEVISEKNFSNNAPSESTQVYSDTKNLSEIKEIDINQTNTRYKPKPKLVRKSVSIEATSGNINPEKRAIALSTSKNTQKKGKIEAKQNIDSQEGIVKNQLSNGVYLNQKSKNRTRETEINKFLEPSIVLNKENEVSTQSNENIENKNEIKENKTDVYSQYGEQKEAVLPPINNDKTETQIKNLNNSDRTIAINNLSSNANELKNNSTLILPLSLDSNQNEAFKNDSTENTKSTLSVDSATNNNKLVVRPDIKHVFSFELGTAYLLGWKDNQGRDAIGFNPIGGINYIFNFNPKFSFITGILYTSVGNINNADYTSKRVKYNFGEEIDYTTISAKNMYYLTVPFKFLYRFKTKNAIGLGLNASYLLDVNSNVSTYNKRFNTLSEAVVTKSNGYKGGFNKYDLQFSLFYRRRLLEKLSIHSEFNLGLLDVKKDKYFRPAQFERNTGFRLTLVYDIFNK